MEYTFSSVIEDGFSVIYAPINYLGASKQLRWNVSCVNGKANAVLLDTEDYAIINKTIYYIDDIYVSLDSCKDIMNKFMNKAGIEVHSDNSGRYILISSKPFNITYMTPRLKYAMGLFYLKNVNISSSSVEDNNTIYHIYRCQAIHFEYLTPVWYVVSNMGTPVQVSSLTDRYTTYFPALNVKVINTFSHEQPLCITNCEYYTVSQASSLSNLRFQIVDSDLNPIKFLSPLYLTVSVEPSEHDESILEAMSVQEQNPNFMTMFQTYIKKNTELMEVLMSKVERGIAAEPEISPIEEKPQYNQPKKENNIPVSDNGVIDIDSTPQVIPNEIPIKEYNGEGNDDKTEEKELGTEQLQEHNISENHNKVEEQESSE